MLFWSGKMNRKRAMRHELRAASSCARTSRTRNSRRATRDPRRGILLLVVLSMLTLFLLIGTAFIVTSKQYQQTNKTRARLTETANSSIDQQDLLNEVLNQLLRDTRNVNSSLRFHSLLRDMYGNDGVRIGPTEQVSFLTRWPDSFDNLELVSRSGNVFSINDTTNPLYPLDVSMNLIGDQFFWVATRFRLPDPTNVNQSQRTPLNLNENYYNGRVITFTDGELQGISARIVRYNVLTQPNPPSGEEDLALRPLHADATQRERNHSFTRPNGCNPKFGQRSLADVGSSHQRHAV